MVLQFSVTKPTDQNRYHEYNADYTVHPYIKPLYHFIHIAFRLISFWRNLLTCSFSERYHPLYLKAKLSALGKKGRVDLQFKLNDAVKNQLKDSMIIHCCGWLICCCRSWEYSQKAFILNKNPDAPLHMPISHMFCKQTINEIDLKKKKKQVSTTLDLHTCRVKLYFVFFFFLSRKK